MPFTVLRILHYHRRINVNLQNNFGRFLAADNCLAHFQLILLNISPGQVIRDDLEGMVFQI